MNNPNNVKVERAVIAGLLLLAFLIYVSLWLLPVSWGGN
jgi:hypothetical protein